MIICTCANVSDNLLKQHINKDTTISELQDAFNVCNNCCICYSEILRLINETNCIHN
jgi:bacterioferritin-associated ferredoxin